MVLGGDYPLSDTGRKNKCSDDGSTRNVGCDSGTKGVVPLMMSEEGVGVCPLKKIGRGVGGFRFFVSGGYPPSQSFQHVAVAV